MSVENKNTSITGFIMASGEGSRLLDLSQKLNRPKHLFPIGDETIVERLVRELSKRCNQILVIVKEEHEQIFNEEFNNKDYPVEIVVKKEEGFYGDFKAAYEASINERMILTVGDLIFPENEIACFLERVEYRWPKTTLVLDSSRFNFLSIPWIFDPRIVLTALSKKTLGEILDLDPESYKQMVFRFFGYYLKNRVRLSFVRTLFNINNRESYQKALKYFE